MFTFILLQKFCNSFECPEPEDRECTRELKHLHKRLYVFSKAYQTKFLCDTVTDGGGWIIIQRRVDRVQSFDRTWKEYTNGFGSICEDHWLGNENIQRITSTGRFELRIDMMFRDVFYYALYNDFLIDNEGNGYRLSFKNYVTGNTSDMLQGQNNQKFSTPDIDNDLDGRKSCARIYQAGWWFSHCTGVTNHLNANLNGRFIFSRDYYGQGVIWKNITSPYYSLHSVEMKIRKI
ncbi:Ficolin-1-A [Bulinus truncatus]|nr:Ficolin-1-A [Bulinus truncatus]